MYASACREDDELAEMIGQKPSIAMLSINLIGHSIHCIREIMYE